MLDWLKNINKEYPEFWKRYLHTFEKKSNRFVILSLETTGLDPDKDIILSIGAVGIENNNIVVSDIFEVVLLQYIYNHDHGISNDFIIESKQPKSLEPQAMEAFVNYLGNAVLIGHRIDFDVAIINTALEKMNVGKLRNDALDIEIMYRKWKELSDDKQLTLDDLRAAFKIPETERISATEDAYTIALLFLKLKARLGIK